MNIERLLNKNQWEAVKNTENPMLVLAGAGSGKTRVVTYKMSYLVNEIGVSPYHILAITFTNKAANEMKERAEQVLGRPMNGLWIGTFHSICVRILRKHFSSNFTIYDTADTNNLVKTIMKDFNVNTDTIKPRQVRNAISSAKNKGMSVKEYESFAGSDYYYSIISKVFIEYEKRMKEANALDFDDLLLKTVNLFEERQDILDEYSKKFQYVFVDEYQDVNDIQYRFIKLISSYHKNITVVGDDNQSIYAFRGANIENILNFEHDFKGAEVVYLNENYRSTQNILNAANELIKHNPQKYERELIANKNVSENVQLYRLNTGVDEAYKVASIIEDLRDKGENYSDIAILYRTNNQSRTFEDVFVRNSIPYEIVGGLRFYERKEVKDVLAYIRLIANPYDRASFERVVNVPRRGIGPKGLAHLIQHSSQLGVNYFESLKMVGNEKGVQLGLNLETIFLQQKDMSLLKIVNETIEKSGYIESYRNSRDPEDQSRLQNIEEFISYVALYQENHPNSNLNDMLAEIALLSDIDNQKSADKVLLMTIHSSKGLEFNNVFVVGLEDGLLPSSMSIEDEKQVEEERRLFYVAITRAKERLILTRADSRMLYGQTIRCKESRFIDEISSAIEIVEERKMEHKESTFNSSSPSTRRYAGVISNRNSNRNKEEFHTGDKINHKLWGAGSVIYVNGDDITIVFESKGVKKLKISLAPLNKM